MNAIIILQLM